MSSSEGPQLPPTDLGEVMSDILIELRQIKKDLNDPETGLTAVLAATKRSFRNWKRGTSVALAGIVVIGSFTVWDYRRTDDKVCDLAQDNRSIIVSTLDIFGIDVTSVPPPGLEEDELVRFGQLQQLLTSPVDCA